MKNTLQLDDEIPPEKIGYNNCTFQIVSMILLVPLVIYMLLDNFGILI